MNNKRILLATCALALFFATQGLGTILHEKVRDSVEALAYSATFVAIKDYGVDVNEREQGKTPLHEAMWMRHSSVIRLLLAHGADVNAKVDVTGETPYHLAIKMATSRDFMAGMGSSFAQEMAKTEWVLDILLEHNANINAQDSEGNTPLHVAINGILDTPERQRRMTLLKWLIDNGAHPGIQNTQGKTPLDIAKEHNITRAIAIVQKTRLGQQFLNAAKIGDQQDLENLITQGTDVNAADDNGYTALHHAAQNEWIGIAQLLLANRADPSLPSLSKQTPLHLAADRGHQLIVRALLASPFIIIDARDNNGWTVLHYAAFEGETVIVRLLLEKGADPTITGKDKLTPAMTAADEDIRHILRNAEKRKR